MYAGVDGDGDRLQLDKRALDIATSVAGGIANTEYRRTPYRFSDFWPPSLDGTRPFLPSRCNSSSSHHLLIHSRTRRPIRLQPDPQPSSLKLLTRIYPRLSPSSKSTDKVRPRRQRGEPGETVDSTISRRLIPESLRSRKQLALRCTP